MALKRHLIRLDAREREEFLAQGKTIYLAGVGAENEHQPAASQAARLVFPLVCAAGGNATGAAAGNGGRVNENPDDWRHRADQFSLCRSGC